MQARTLVALLIAAFPGWAQVLDVDGDGMVGSREVLAVAEQWKEDAKDANDHNHLGQTWEGEGSPLKLHGSFSEILVVPSADSPQVGVVPFPRRASAPLVLDNTNKAGYGLKLMSDGPGISLSSEGPDLILRGDSAIISATDEAYQNLTVRSNNNVYLYLDFNRDDPHTSGLYVFGRDGYSILELSEDGDLWLRGTLTAANLKTGNDLSTERPNKNRLDAPVEDPETRNTYDGVTVLDELGEAWVELPNDFEALDSEFRYQLTPIGAPAPSLHVAEELQGSRFKIAGGSAGLKVSWQVRGGR